MSEPWRIFWLIVLGVAAFAVSRMVDSFAITNWLLAASCTLIFIAVARPTGELIESHTGERAAKWAWIIVLGLFAVGTFVSFYGVKQVGDSMARQATEAGGPKAKQALDTKAGDAAVAPWD